MSVGVAPPQTACRNGALDSAIRPWIRHQDHADNYQPTHHVERQQAFPNRLGNRPECLRFVYLLCFHLPLITAQSFVPDRVVGPPRHQKGFDPRSPRMFSS